MSTPEWLLESEIGWGLPHPLLALPGLAAMALRSRGTGLARVLGVLRGRWHRPA